MDLVSKLKNPRGKRRVAKKQKVPERPQFKQKRRKDNGLRSRISEKRKLVTTSRPTGGGLTDFRLLYTVAGLLGFGLLMIFSSSAIIAFTESGNTFDFFLKQILWIAIGTVLAYVVYRLPLELISKTSVISMVVSIVLLVAVLFVGKDLNGARRWIDLGSFDLQPSEVAKLGFIIYLSAWLSRKRPSVKSYKEVLRQHLNDDLLPFMMLMGVVCFLIVLQPDLDTAVIIAVTALSVYFISGKDAIHTMGSLFIVVTTSIVGGLAAMAAPYRLSRLRTYVDFWITGDVQDKLDTGFQVWNNLIAIGTGGFLGVGFGESRQKLFYLQNAAFTDSIFSIIAEEFGLIGSLALIIAFLYFMSLGVEIAQKAPDKFSALLAMGITTWIVLQAFLNIGANLALIPFGGIPLPFISYGGSSTLVVLAGVGILLNIQRNSASSKTARKLAHGLG